MHYFFLGENHKENCTPSGMCRLQSEVSGSTEALQTFRAGWRQEEEGTDDPVLSWLINKSKI